MFDKIFDKMFIISFIVLLLVDSFYLQIIKKTFENQIEMIQGTKMKINVFAVIMCYIFLAFGLNYFILRPNRSIKDAFILGLVIYGVFETTSWALFSKWSPKIVIIDTIWGASLFAITTFIIRKFIKLN